MLEHTYAQSTEDLNSVDWASVRGMTSSQWHDFWEEKHKEGYRVVDMEIDDDNSQTQYGGVFQKNVDNRDWASLRDLTSTEFAEKWNSYRDTGFRIIDQDVYQISGSRRYSMVWEKNTENLPWASYRNVSSQSFSEKFIKYKQEGFRPIDVEAYSNGNSTQYAAIWVKNTKGWNWALWRDLTSQDYSDKFNEYRDKGYRVYDFESYEKSGQQRYAAIFVKNTNGRAWQSWRNMSANSFGNKWQQLWCGGYRLVDFEQYPTAAGTRYAGVWRQNNSRPSWPLKGSIDSLLDGHQEEFDVPGISVAIAQDGKLVYLRGAGFADIDDNKSATCRTVYRMASVSKAIAGVLAKRLEQQGTIDLDLNTRAYAPTLPVLHTHTNRQTLSNRSGVGHYSHNGWPADTSVQYTTALEAAMFFWGNPLLHNPGEDYTYSTHGYTLLGAALEGAVGDPVSEIIENELTYEFNLSSLRAEDRSLPESNRATLYHSNNSEATPDNISWKVLGGGMEGSVYDLARFGVKLLNGSILTSENLDDLWTPPDTHSNYALGWSTGTEKGYQVVAKNGGQLGANSYIRMYPEKGIVIAVASNRQGGGHSATTLGRDIGSALLDVESN